MHSNVELILSLLTEGFTIDEVQKELNLSNQEFNEALKTIRDLGYNYTKTFSDDGNIIIKAGRTLNLRPRENVRVNVKDSTFHTIIMSDPHIGGPYEHPERLTTVADYAIDHDIHTIFDTGDIINNYYPEQEPDLRVKDPIKQAKKYLRYVPYRDKLIYFNLGGNHDYKSLVEQGFDSLRYYEDRRYDQVSLGYGLCYVHLKNDAIALAHELKGSAQPINSTIVFRGHSHKFKNRDAKIIYVPALTDNYQGPYEFVPLPGFLDVEFLFYEGRIYKINLRHLTFIQNELRLASEETMVIRPDYEERRIKSLQKRRSTQNWVLFIYI